MKPVLTEKEFASAARVLRCEVAAVKAAAEVEAPKGGFLPSGLPTILFEAHQFDRNTQGRFRKSHPKLSTRTWDEARKLYQGGEGEWARFDEAQRLDRAAAILSCSWGKFQVMGFNWKACGHLSPQSFVNAMFESEARHLEAFVEYVRASGLADELQRLDWVGFARGYNGPGYWKNQYDKKLAAAYAKHKKGASR